jgi:hypothetical protein
MTNALSKPRVLPFASAASLLLFCATCVLWIGSYWIEIGRPDVMSKRGYRISTTRGRVYIQRLLTDVTPSQQYFFVLPIPRVVGDRQIAPSRQRALMLRQIEGNVGNTVVFGFGITFAKASISNGFGFGLRRISDRGNRPGWQDVTTISIPYWSVCALASGFPCIAIWRWHRRIWRSRRRKRLGLCRSCGYDLRSTPQAAGPQVPRCPECGARGKASG